MLSKEDIRRKIKENEILKWKDIRKDKLKAKVDLENLIYLVKELLGDGLLNKQIREDLLLVRNNIIYENIIWLCSQTKKDSHEEYEKRKIFLEDLLNNVIGKT